MCGVCFMSLPCSAQCFSAERCEMISTVCCNLFEACSVLFQSLFGVLWVLQVPDPVDMAAEEDGDLVGEVAPP